MHYYQKVKFDKAKFVWIFVIVVFVFLLFPIKQQLKDGGTVVYRSITVLYEVRNWNREYGDGTVDKGTSIIVLGHEVYNDVENVKKD